MKPTLRIVLAVTASVVVLPALAQDSGFLSDYSLLEARDDDAALDRVYVAEGISAKLEKYNAIMVDQPEIFIADDTKYKGAKPDALSQLASTMRYAMMERLEAGGYNVTDEPGPNTLFMRWAVTNLYLEKKKRGFLTYTPLGAVVHATHQASIKDLWKKIDIVEMTIEIEFLDSVSGELLAAAVDSSGHRKDKKAGIEEDPVTWEELDAEMKTVGERVRCRMDNAKLPEAQRADCTAILIEPVYEEED